MSARARPRGLHLRHVCPPNGHQRRHLNHFISRADASLTSAEATPVSNDPSSTFTLAVKDNIATASFPTTCASPFLIDYRSPYEATIVSQLRARGARLVGTTNMDEFGMGSHSTHSVFGPVAQDPEGDAPIPADTSSLLSAGGSSGGSAVAVAKGEADVALGTDTGGSVRLPAAYCAVVGFKPSYGMISRFGVVPYANSLDTVGFLAREVSRIRDLIVGGGTRPGLWAEHDPQDPTSLSSAARTRCAGGREGYKFDTAWGKKRPADLLRGLRVGIPLEYNIEELDPAIRDSWARVAALLQSSFGVRAVPVSLPTTRHALAAYYVIAPAEASSNLAKYDGIRYGARATSNTTAAAAAEDGSAAAPASDAAEGGVLYAASRAAGFGAEVKRRILLGGYTLSAAAMDNYFLQAQRVRRLVRRDFDRVFALANPLHDGDADPESEPPSFDLSDLDERVPMADKRGPEEEVDFLLCPTAPTPPPTLREVLAKEKNPVEAYMNDVFTVPASLAGLPAVSVPVSVQPGGAGEAGRPGAAGLQLIGQYWDDARLLGVAEALVEVLRDEGMGR
ncbi:hypothetical protein VTJ83DRAFT_1743 [Remersonia thermophila]|uniref:Glutamyl-tRNA(Gln) amidotransferase subunit A, mitochondrial n=1 Tax=Remersonia thermophila TaxID=72144 RepID=A0ABR4DGZ5_9PEZI